MATKGKSDKKNKNASVNASSNQKVEKKASLKQVKVEEVEKETLAFKVISETQTTQIAECNTVEEVQSKIIEMMKITNEDTDLGQSGVMDTYVAAAWWAKEQNFSVEQQSAFFTVIHTLLENIKTKHLTLVDNMREFKKLLQGVGLENPETCGGLQDLFTAAQAKDISDYVDISFFQHHKLLEFVFTHTQAEEIIGADLEVDVPAAADLPWPPPLEEALCMDLYQLCHDVTQHLDAAEEEAGEAAAEAPEAGDVTPAGDVTEDGEENLLRQLRPEQVERILQEEFQKMLGQVETEVASKLRDKENEFITRINKIHKVADAV